MIVPPFSPLSEQARNNFVVEASFDGAVTFHSHGMEADANKVAAAIRLMGGETVVWHWDVDAQSWQGVLPWE